MYLLFLVPVLIFVLLVISFGKPEEKKKEELTVTSIIDDCIKNWYAKHSKTFGGFDQARLFLIYTGLNKTNYFLNKTTFSVFADTIEKATSVKIHGDGNNHPLSIFDISFAKADYPSVTAEFLYSEIRSKIDRHKDHLNFSHDDKFINQCVAMRIVTDTIQVRYCSNFKSLNELLVVKTNKSKIHNTAMSLV